VARPSPATSRLVDLLNLLAAHPGESFRLSEIARRLNFNKATAHGMLGALADAEYLVHNDETKEFALGPAVVALGYSAVQNDARLAQLAMDELRALSEATGTQAVANVATSEDFTVIASAGEPASGRETYVGYRGRLVPPVGMVFHAWASRGRIDAWLDRISATAHERARYDTLLAAVRERGFSISADEDVRERLESAVERLEKLSDQPSMRDELQRVIHALATEELELLEVIPDRTYQTRQISAPVFDSQGGVRLGIYLLGLEVMSGEELLKHAALTTRAAEGLTRMVAGTLESPATTPA
jgi:DNA-binding IclR family transcriptional regulator